MKRFFVILVSNIFGLAELLLLIRVVMRGLSANSATFIVAIIYQVTDFLLIPVRGIFPNAAFSLGVIDVVAITAMILYLIAFGVLAKVISILTGRA